jgi:ferric-dicitrate binding protein FerR (iron transport regulator)
MKQDYLTYEPEDLAQEEAFLQWVRGGDPTSAPQWEAWLAAHPDQSEKVATARALVAAVRWEVPALGEERKKALWNAIDTATSEAKIKQLPQRRRPTWTWAAAASIAILLAAGWWWTNSSADTPLMVSTERTETSKETLPDGSLVSMNAVSSITYTPENWQRERTILLEGEAFFEVEKGSPFIVKTPMGQVEVLGTSFNVEARDGIFRVNCYTGKVKVTTSTGETIILTPQEGTFLQDGKLHARTISNQNDIAWQDQIHHFDDVPLEEVFAALQRQYAISVKYPAEIGKRQYAGFFKSNDLEQALQTVCWPLNLQFSMDGQQVTISAND